MVGRREDMVSPPLLVPVSYLLVCDLFEPVPARVVTAKFVNKHRTLSCLDLCVIQLNELQGCK